MKTFHDIKTRFGKSGLLRACRDESGGGFSTGAMREYSSYEKEVYCEFALPRIEKAIAYLMKGGKLEAHPEALRDLKQDNWWMDKYVQIKMGNEKVGEIRPDGNYDLNLCLVARGCLT